MSPFIVAGYNTFSMSGMLSDKGFDCFEEMNINKPIQNRRQAAAVNFQKRKRFPALVFF